MEVLAFLAVIIALKLILALMAGILAGISIAIQALAVVGAWLGAMGWGLLLRFLN